MSKFGVCQNCGIEVRCTIDDVVVMSDGKRVPIRKAPPHGCPEEFDQWEFSAEDLGYTKDMIDRLFKDLA